MTTAYKETQDSRRPLAESTGIGHQVQDNQIAALLVKAPFLHIAHEDAWWYACGIQTVNWLEHLVLTTFWN